MREGGQGKTGPDTSGRFFFELSGLVRYARSRPPLVLSGLVRHVRFCPPFAVFVPSLVRLTMSLTKAQLEHFRKRLLEERERVTRDLARYHAETESSLRDESGELSAAPVHLADLGTDTEDQELDASNAARQSFELEEIDAALERLYHRPEEYGKCEKTGQPIPYERLDLIPWARTC